MFTWIGGISSRGPASLARRISCGDTEDTAERLSSRPSTNPASQRRLLQREVRLSAKREHPRAYRIAQAHGRAKVASVNPDCFPDVHLNVARPGEPLSAAQS